MSENFCLEALVGYMDSMCAMTAHAQGCMSSCGADGVWRANNTDQKAYMNEESASTLSPPSRPLLGPLLMAYGLPLLNESSS